MDGEKVWESEECKGLMGGWWRWDERKREW